MTHHTNQIEQHARQTRNLAHPDNPMQTSTPHESGLIATERAAIVELAAAGPMFMSELGAAIGLSRAAVTALVDRLVSIGLLERTADTEDRRRTELSLTPWGAVLVETAFAFEPTRTASAALRERVAVCA